jgi:hypothetical protein
MEKGNSLKGCDKQEFVYNLNLANHLGLSKSEEYLSITQCFEFNTSFVMHVTRLLMCTIPEVKHDKRILFIME